MPIEEPRPDLGLWPQVKAISGWPEPNEDLIRDLADGWRRTGQRFVAAAGYDIGGLADGWPDIAGQGFQSRVGEHLRTAGQTGSQMAELARRADGFAAEVTTVKSDIVALIRANVPRYATIPQTVPVIDQPRVQADFVARLAAEVKSMISAAADRIANQGGAGLASLAGPPAGASPAEVKQWWDSLSRGQQAALLSQSPDTIRNLDGIPAQVRDQANRAVLQREIDALQARKDEILANPFLRSSGASQGEVRELDDKLNGLNEIKHRLEEQDRRNDAEPHRRTEPQVMLLGFDTAGDGRAIISIGNPDTARNVATMVPGTTVDLGSVQGEVDRANRVLDAAQAADPNSSTAAVAWIGYDTPDTIPQAGDESYAAEGKASLDRFQDGLRATHEGPASRNTVIGHSYGTTLVGHAARDHSLAADQVILASSPGTGSPDVSHFRLDGVDSNSVGQRVYATTAPNDPIRVTNLRIDMNHIVDPDPLRLRGEPEPRLVDVALGIDPTLPEFGARTFETDADPNDPHGAPFVAGNRGLRTIGEIVAGGG